MIPVRRVPTAMPAPPAVDLGISRQKLHSCCSSSNDYAMSRTLSRLRLGYLAFAAVYFRVAMEVGQGGQGREGV